MSTQTGDTQSRQEKGHPGELRRETTNLAGQYGQIGISAVAAALRYTDTGKKPAYTPEAPVIEARFIEMAA